MTLRTKLSLMFFGAVQVAFLTAVGSFWGVQSWQLLTDDLTLIHAQSRRLQRLIDAPGDTHRLDVLRDHAQTLEEGQRLAALQAALGGGAGAAPALRRAGGDLQRYYDDEVQRLRARARSVTRLSTVLFFSIVAAVLGAMMAYFVAIRVWLVRPIQALSRATAVISTGDLDHRIAIAGRDELGSLATSINGMAASLAEIQRRLLQAERFAMIGEMSAYVAHNIRNPVASIRATAQAELDRLGTGDTRRDGFLDVVRAADRIVSWVGDLLRFSSPVSLLKTRADMNALVSECIDLAHSQLGEKRIQLAVALDPTLPPVALDQNKMEQVLAAVLANAVDASPPAGTIDVSSALRAGPNGVPHANVRIGDRGAGIPESRLRTLFTPFATTKVSGTGLGLALAHKIIAAHNGTIVVGNRDGGGTLVEISLPAAAQESEA
jgi:signal transduction histidine kinase